MCQARGLNQHQGVMIPRQNLENLMLRRDVVSAVEEGRFHIYAVSTIDEGMEVLTGVAAGGRREDGTYFEETVNYQVNKQLQEMATRLKHFYGPTTEEKPEVHS